MKHESAILIVDTKEVADEMIPIISRELSTTHIKHVNNLADAMEIIASDVHIDLIFADWHLVGSKFMDAVRRDKENKLTPVIAMSDLDTDVVIATAMRHGASDYLAKPFLERALKHKLQRVAQLQQQQRLYRLHPDHTVVIDIDMESGETIKAELYDFSLAGCCTRIDYAQRYNIAVGDRGTVHLHLGQFQVDLESRVTRTGEYEESPEEKIMVLFWFNDPHEERVEKLKELLDEYVAKW